MREIALDVTGLACRRAGRLVFTELGFALRPGEALVVTGRNGAGKSTLLAALAGRVRPEAGSIAFHGAGATLPESLHWLGHRDALKAQLTPSENLRFAAACLESARPEIEPALRRVGLSAAAHLPTAWLSAGQRRRLALARLLAAPRPLWLLDEPSSALDADGLALLDTLMAAHRDGGGMIVAATHTPLPLPGATMLDLARPAETAA
jgi:heme exporter protein A